LSAPQRRYFDVLAGLDKGLWHTSLIGSCADCMSRSATVTRGVRHRSGASLSGCRRAFARRGQSSENPVFGLRGRAARKDGGRAEALPHFCVAHPVKSLDREDR
jgi:hypothetical protein